MAIVQEVLRGVEVEFDDPAQDDIWIRVGVDDTHWCLPAESPITIEGHVRARTYAMHWLVLHRGERIDAILTFHDGEHTIAAATFRRL